MQAGLFGNVSEGAIAIIFVEAVGGARRSALEQGPGEEKDIHPAVIVVVNEGAATAVGLQNVFVDLSTTVNGGRVKSGGGGYVGEMRVKRAPGRRLAGHGLGCVPAHALGEGAAGGEGESRAEGSAHEVAARNGHGRRVPWRWIRAINEPIMTHTKC